MDKLAVRKGIKKQLEPVLEIVRYFRFGAKHKIDVDESSIFIHNGALPNTRPMTRIVAHNNSTFTIQPGGRIKPGAKIMVNGGRLRIGKNSYFNVGLTLICREQILIGDDCAIGPEVVIRDFDGHGVNTRPLTIEDHVWIGQRAIILKGTHIGANSVVGAGAVLAGKKYPPRSLIVGNPAVVVRSNIDDWV